MGFFDIFNTPFLFSVLIIIMFFCLMFLYFSNKITEQDHKLLAMSNLISLLAQQNQESYENYANMVRESQTCKNEIVNVLDNKLINISDSSLDNNLINVSDEEKSNNSSEYDNSSDEDEDETEDEEEQIYLSDEDIIELTNKEQTDDNIKTIFIEEKVFDTEYEYSENEFAEQELSNESQVLYEEFLSELKEELFVEELKEELNSDVKTNLEEELNIEELTNNVKEDNSMILKSMNLGETDDALTEYKKLPTSKLREIIVNKGIVSDASKFKKNEILKLLCPE